MGILRGIRIGADAEAAILVHNAHELDEDRILAGIHSLDLGIIYKTLSAIEGEPVALLINLGTLAETLL